MEILINAVAIFLAAYMLDGVEIKNFVQALIAALVLAVLNFFLKPVLTFLLLPVNILTLGLFSLVINAGLLLLASKMVSGFKIRSFGTAFFFGILISVLNTLLHWFF